MSTLRPGTVARLDTVLAILRDAPWPLTATEIAIEIGTVLDHRIGKPRPAYLPDLMLPLIYLEQQGDLVRHGHIGSFRYSAARAGVDMAAYEAALR